MLERKLSKTVISSVARNLIILLILTFKISPLGRIKVRKGGQGWTDSQIVLSLVLLNLAGGDCVDDVKIIEADDGFCEVLKKAEIHGLRRKVRRTLLRRW